MRKIYLVAILFCLLNCKNKNLEDTNSAQITDSPVVLFNVKDYDRNELSSFINQVSSCDPKVIGINVIFEGLKNSSVDSALETAIKNSGKVILIEEVSSDDQVIKSHPLFSDVAKGNGIRSYVKENNVITSFVPLFENDQGQELDFCYLMLFEYDPFLANKLFYEFYVNEEREIIFKRTLNQFEILDETNLQCDLISNKIVLFGYLGPLDEDTRVTPVDKKAGNDSKTYSTVILANIVLNYLDQGTKAK